MAVTVGAPYFDFFAVAFGLPIVLLMGLGPLVAWRRASLHALGRAVAWPGRRRARRGLAAARARAPGRARPGSIGYTFARLRPRGDRARVRPRDARAQGDRLGDLARRVHEPRRAEPAPLRRLRRPRGDRPARHRRDRDRRLLDARPRGASRPASTIDGRPATRSRTCGSTEQPGRRTRSSARARMAVERDGKRARDDHAGEEQLPGRAADVERGRDPLRPAARRGSVRDRRRVRRRATCS